MRVSQGRARTATAREASKWRSTWDPQLRLVHVMLGHADGGLRSLDRALGYHMRAPLVGLAVTRTIDPDPPGWTLTHLDSGRSLGVFAESPAKIAALGQRLAVTAIDWTQRYEMLKAHACSAFTEAYLAAVKAEALVFMEKIVGAASATPTRGWFEVPPATGWQEIETT